MRDIEAEKIIESLVEIAQEMHCGKPCERFQCGVVRKAIQNAECRLAGNSGPEIERLESAHRKAVERVIS